MKLFNYLTSGVLLFSLSVALFSCAEGYKKDYSVPGPVSDISSVAGYGRITMKWKAPDDPLYQYTRIEYVDPTTGRQAWAYADKFDQAADGYTTRIIGGFIDEGDHDFTFTTHSFSFGISEPVTVTGHVLESPFNSVAGTVDVTPDIMGAIVSWENGTGTPVLVRAVYNDPDGNEKVAEMVSGAASGRMRVGTTGLGEQQIKVAVLDETGRNSSVVESATITPTGDVPARINSGEWSVVECVDAWITGQPLNHWVAENLFDGDQTRPWHTDPTGTGHKYPYHTIIDLKYPVVITSVDLFARTGGLPTDVLGPNKVGFELSEDGETWINAGTFNFDRLNTAKQTFNISQISYGVRYVKFIMIEGPIKDYSYMGEMSLTGKLR